MSKTHFSAPGCYRITVGGVLPQCWFDRYGPMRLLAPSQDTKSVVETIIQGKVADQTELAGILNSLYELHLPLLAVQFIGDDVP